MNDFIGNDKLRHNLMPLVNLQKRIFAVKNKDLIERIRQQEIFMGLMMIGEIEASVQLMRMAIEKADLMRHGIKKECNLLLKQMQYMQRLATNIDHTLTKNCCSAILTGCENQFAQDSGSVITGLQNRFHILLKDETEQLFICIKRSADNVKHPQAEVYACIYLVGALTQLALEVSEFYVRTLRNTFNIESAIHDTRNEKTIITSVSRMIAGLPGKDVTKQDKQIINRHIASLGKLITGSKVVDVLENTEMEIYRLYCEYFLAMLRCNLHENQTPSYAMRRSLFLKLSDKESICSLYKELKAAPIRAKGEDVYDLSLRFTKFHAPITDEFRNLVFRGTCRLSAEALKRIEIESLKLEVVENDGILPLGSLRKMYADAGSKQAVVEIIDLMGEEGKKTAKLLEEMEEEELSR